ncbi:glucuronate isomerase [Halobacillus sp. BAB-2008]|uniref:glucuronate isomerase n=1 Tax=Halobacillus sp. BAB-2008 TaxID=1246484 RepID=UPI0002A5064F|nr:glucuronate isomerase [Halobacillus sp. BAB-2008]ELK48446.1 glucuronate isomerase [Halobacillus sp. BAB-2008]
MPQLLTDDFLLTTAYAKELYHDYARDMPIIDFHNHLPPQEVADDSSFETITDVWLSGDHYKWRLMRANGIKEHFITGNASKKEKFDAWAETVPNTLGNPLFQWTQMELKNYFGIHDFLSPETADDIWERTNAALKEKSMSVRSLLAKDRVEFLGTTDDPTDDLSAHQWIAKEQLDVKVAPSFRPDQALNIAGAGFISWTEKLGEVVDENLNTYKDFLTALSNRIEYFDHHGCRASDHGLNRMFYEESTEAEVERIYQKRLNGGVLTDLEVEKYQTRTLLHLAADYSKRGWVMQLHIGPLRNNNTKMLEAIGRDSGYDSIGDAPLADALSRFLDSLEYEDTLPKTVLFGLNPRDNYILATMAGNFQDGSVPGKVQFGTAWWFNDHIDGMEDQMKILANVGLIRHFIGMLTDSRSFLSFSRHEYFRRILCNLLGRWMEEGRVPADSKWLGSYVQDISYYNAKRYFNL